MINENEYEAAQRFLDLGDTETAREILRRWRENCAEEDLWRLHEMYGAYFHDIGDAEGAAQAYLNAARADRFLRAQRRHYANYLFALHYLSDGQEGADPVSRKKALAAAHFAAAELYAATVPFAPPAWDHGEKIRLGCLAPQIADDASSQFYRAILAADSPFFSVKLYDASPCDGDFSAEELAREIRAAETDILFDLGGHSAGGVTLAIMAYRPAKVQVCGIGWFDTTGLDSIDCVIADEILAPPGEEEFFAEKFLRLPRAFCWQPSPSLKNIAPLTEVNGGDDSETVVFGCFANFMKITDEWLETWREIKKSVPKARLILQDVTPLRARQKFMGERVAALHLSDGVEIRPASDDYAPQLAGLDLMLDTFPYNGGAMTATALYLGTPVLTLRGTSYASRFGASILTAARLPGLIAENRASYVEKAVCLAKNRSKLSYLKKSLPEQIKNSPLTDGAGYRRELAKSFGKILTGKFLPVLLTAIFLIMAMAPTCRAAAGWVYAGQALGVYAAYKQTLTDLLRLGNNPYAQFVCQQQDEAVNGLAANPADRAPVDEIMAQLIKRGKYELKVNSLPFTWAVNNNPKFNASCYPTNYISVNRGLVRGLNGERDELAAVLAHEMVHGLEQHSAHKYAEATAEILGMHIIGMETDAKISWQHFQNLVGYAVARDVMSPAETEADEEGFWLMCGAGFNPGGAPASMARMGDYLRYRTDDIWEFDANQAKDPAAWSDHPDTSVREARLNELLTLYSAGHVQVKDRREVWLDNELIYTAVSDNLDYNNALENAYYVAGGLAKAFHDFSAVEEWQFRSVDGKPTFLTDDEVFACLRRNVEPDEKLVAAVTEAYRREPVTQARGKLLSEEIKRRDKLAKTREKALAADGKFARALRENSDAYADLGLTDLAQTELNRALTHPAQDNLAECYVIGGRIKGINGDFTDALREANRGIDLDKENFANYLNRADIYRMQGNFAAAVVDAERALALKQTPVVLSLCAQLRDEVGDRTRAKELYAALHKKDRKWEIPSIYLREIDPEAANSLQKLQTEAAEERAENKKAPKK